MSDLFDTRLKEALAVARGGNTALVIVPRASMRHLVLTQLAHLLDRGKDWNARWTQDALHFDGTRGSVRIYPADHIEYDAKLKRMRGYPVSVPIFLHPEVEGL